MILNFLFNWFMVSVLYFVFLIFFDKYLKGFRNKTREELEISIDKRIVDFGLGFSLFEIIILFPIIGFLYILIFPFFGNNKRKRK